MHLFKYINQFLLYFSERNKIISIWLWKKRIVVTGTEIQWRVLCTMNLTVMNEIPLLILPYFSLKLKEIKVKDVLIVLIVILLLWFIINKTKKKKSMRFKWQTFLKVWIVCFNHVLICQAHINRVRLYLHIAVLYENISNYWYWKYRQIWNIKMLILVTLFY